MDVKIHSIHYRNGRLWYRTWQWPIRDMKTQLFILWNLNGKRYYFRFAVLFSIFSFVKAVLLDLKNFFQDSGFFSINFNFFKLRVKKNLGFFKVMFCQKKKTVFYCLEQCACHIPAYHSCWLKENEQDGVDDPNGFICFILCLSRGMSTDNAFVYKYSFYIREFWP